MAKSPSPEPSTLHRTGIVIQKPASNPDEGLKYPLELCVRPICTIPGKKRFEVICRDMGDKRNRYPAVSLAHEEVEPTYEKWLNDKLVDENYLETIWERTDDGGPCIIHITQIAEPK